MVAVKRPLRLLVLGICFVALFGFSFLEIFSNSNMSAAEAACKEGNDLYAAGDVKGAITAYSKAIGIDSKSFPKFYSNRAQAYLDLGKPQKALHDLEKAMELDSSPLPPQQIKYFYRAARAHFELGQLPEAREFAEKLLKLDPSNKDGAALQLRIGDKQGGGKDGTPQGIKRDGEAFLAAKKHEPDVQVLSSGVMFKVLASGDASTAKSPTLSDECLVHYSGTLIDGTKFDSSYDRGTPAEFAPNQVIRGWTECLQLMVEGDKWEVYIPHELAYGVRGSPPRIPGFSTLVFTIELLKVKRGGKSATDARAALTAALAH